MLSHPPDIFRCLDCIVSIPPYGWQGFWCRCVHISAAGIVLVFATDGGLLRLGEFYGALIRIVDATFGNPFGSGWQWWTVYICIQLADCRPFTSCFSSFPIFSSLAARSSVSVRCPLLFPPISEPLSEQTKRIAFLWSLKVVQC